MWNRIDMTGLKFGRLTVVSCAHLENKRLYWNCVCDCGNKAVIWGASLRNGTTRSCGCFRREEAKERTKTHGKSRTKVYSTWYAMRGRCNDPNDHSYPDYGARGIKVSSEWNNSFEAFYRDMGDPLSPKHSLDRINNDGNYCKENCKWSTPKEQANNRRDTQFLTHNGETKTVKQWAEALDMDYTTLWVRLKHGWSTEQALTKPTRETIFLSHDEKTITISEWARQTGLSVGTIHARLKRGWSIKKTLTSPPSENRLNYNGESRTLSEWAEYMSVAFITLYCRLQRGWTIEKTLTTPVRKSKRIYKKKQ